MMFEINKPEGNKPAPTVREADFLSSPKHANDLQKPVRVSLDLDPAKHKTLKLEALEKGLTLAALIRLKIELAG